MRLQAVSTCLLQQMSNPKLGMMTHLLKAIDEVHDPVAVISIILQVRLTKI